LRSLKHNGEEIMNRAVEQLIDLAFQEDIGPGDLTSDHLVGPNLEGRGVVRAKEPFVLAGLHVAERVFKRLHEGFNFKRSCQDGDVIQDGQIILEIEGKLHPLLVGERTALNFLQRLSGIATHVRAFVDVLRGTRVRLVDTRKTAPGWRVLEKYAVQVGGAHNHRMGLYDGVLIKENHITACGGILKAVKAIRPKVSHLVKIEVEVMDLAGVAEALEAKADVIMLDNMELDQIREAVAVIKGKALVEVSGGVTKARLVELADAGVDIISVGALTHSARCVDISMLIE
jgi:nicotinate-nucleotide pyrophosphorylase (carboxylating)